MEGEEYMFKRNLLTPVFFSFLIFIIFFLDQNYSSAAVNGKISGKVYDAESNDPLVGANIFVEGTNLGAAANVNGEFFILNVPPGKHTVIASMMGYETIRKQEVLVQIGQTTILNFTLNTTAIEGIERVIVADRSIIQTDVANSQTILQGSDIAALPASKFKGILAIQVGIRDVDSRGLFMRGQRQDAISMLVDGMQARDNLDNQVYTRFNPDELEQVKINAGGFDASYGDASAGLITLVTKEGGQTYSGTFDYRQSGSSRKHFGPPITYYWDQYYFHGPNPDSLWNALNLKIKGGIYPAYSEFADRPELLKELYRWRMRDQTTNYGEEQDKVLNTTFGGPIPFLKNTTFFTSYRREKNYYLYAGPLDHFFDQNGMMKITSQLNPNMKLSLNFRYTETTGLNRYDYYLMEASRGDFSAINPDFQTEKRYVYEGVEQVAWSGYGAWPYTGQIGMSDRYRNQYGLTFTHMISPSTFYELKLMATYFRSYGRQGTLRDTSATVTLVDPADPGYSVTLRGPHALAPLGYWPVTINDPFMLLGGTYGYSESCFANDVSLRLNLISQLNKYNQLNIGFQYTYYDIMKNEDRDQPPNRDDSWRWHVYPQKFAFWASDKLEFKGMVLNIGLRGDVRIPDEWLDWRNNPWDYHWSDLMPADSNWAGPHYNPPWKLALAPRLKVSHHIGEKAKIFFNWDHHYQDPSFERQYMYYTRGAALAGSGWTMYGDPELPYIKSIQYELGYEQNLFDILRFSLTGYYKDVKNLLMDRIRMAGEPRPNDPYQPRYGVHGPNRYLSSQGLEVRLEKRAGRFWTAWFNFNYAAYSRGVYGFETIFEDITEPENPFEYDEENLKRAPESRYNFGADIHTPSQFGPRLLGFYPAADMSLNFLLWWQQQPAFSYNPNGLEAPYKPVDNMRWKAHWGVNMVFTKRLEFNTFITPVFYMEVYNLFNTKNMFRGAFNDDADTWPALLKYIKLLEEVGSQPGERGDLAAEAIGNNPGKMLPMTGTIWDLYLNPRQIWFGIRFELK